MNVVDSGAWLEYIGDGPNAGFFAPAIEKTAELLVPTSVLFEVFRHLVRHAGEGPALEVTAVMRQGQIIDLDATLALEAARLAALHQLDLTAGSLLAVAGLREATLWTTDRRLTCQSNVRYRACDDGASGQVRP